MIKLILCNIRHYSTVYWSWGRGSAVELSFPALSSDKARKRSLGASGGGCSRGGGGDEIDLPASLSVSIWHTLAFLRRFQPLDPSTASASTMLLSFLHPTRWKHWEIAAVVPLVFGLFHKRLTSPVYEKLVLSLTGCAWRDQCQFKRVKLDSSNWKTALG